MLICIFDALFHNIVDLKSGHITRKVKITKKYCSNTKSAKYGAFKLHESYLMSVASIK